MKTAQMESGRSLIEMLVVVMMIALISGGAIAGIGQGWRAWQQQGIYDETQALAREALDLVAWQRNVIGVDIQLLGCDNKLRGEKCAVEGTNGYWKNGFDGETHISFNGDGQLEVRQTNIPESVCEWLLCDAEWVEIFPEVSCESASTYCEAGEMKFYTMGEGSGESIF